MAKLSAKERRNLKPSDFLGPNRTFPGNDKSHLEAAIRDAPRAAHAGNISMTEAKAIQRKARRRLLKAA